MTVVSGVPGDLLVATIKCQLIFIPFMGCVAYRDSVCRWPPSISGSIHVWTDPATQLQTCQLLKRGTACAALTMTCAVCRGPLPCYLCASHLYVICLAGVVETHKQSVELRHQPPHTIFIVCNTAMVISVQLVVQRAPLKGDTFRKNSGFRADV